MKACCLIIVALSTRFQVRNSDKTRNGVRSSSENLARSPTSSSPNHVSSSNDLRSQRNLSPAAGSSAEQQAKSKKEESKRQQQQKQKDKEREKKENRKSSSGLSSSPSSSSSNNRGRAGSPAKQQGGKGAILQNTVSPLLADVSFCYEVTRKRILTVFFSMEFLH